MNSDGERSPRPIPGETPVVAPARSHWNAYIPAGVTDLGSGPSVCIHPRRTRRSLATMRPATSSLPTSKPILTANGAGSRLTFAMSSV